MSIRSVAFLAMAAAFVGPAAQAEQPVFCREASAPSTFVLAVNYRTHDGKENEVAEILTQLSEATRAEPGNLAFIVHRSPTDPRGFFLYEQYRDEAAFQAHQATPHFRNLVVGRAIPLLERRERVVLSLMPCRSR